MKRFVACLFLLCSVARCAPSAHLTFPQHPIYRAADMELDTMRHAAARDGRQLNLSAREFAVLEALMRAHPAVLSAEDLLEQAWDEHTDPFSNIVSVTVSRLRRKLGEPPVIGTILNVGYHIADPSA